MMRTVEDYRAHCDELIEAHGEKMSQLLVLVTKAADGTVRTRQLLPVRFVPLTGRN